MKRLYSMARIASVVAALALAACNGPGETFQGWIEADLVFVGPDEAGRVETLSVREGDRVAAGAPLFTLDADQQKADVLSGEATLANDARMNRSAERIRASFAFAGTVLLGNAP